jgi:integrase
MARKQNLLDDMRLRKAVEKAIKNGEKASFPDGKGLTLVVTEAGRARFIHRYPYGGRYVSRWFDGTYPKLSLAKARAMRDADLEMLDNGVRPVEPERDEDGKAIRITLAHYARAHFKQLAPPHELKEGAKSAWLRDMTVHVGDLATMNVADIRFTDIARALECRWNNHVASPTGVRLSERLQRLLRHHHVNTFPDEPFWLSNETMSLTSMLKDRLGHRAHFPQERASLPFEDAPAFMYELRKHETMSARALEFIILTASRVREVTGAKWGEIDRDAKTWTVPVERLKTEQSKGPKGKPHVVPLSDGALATLDRAAANRIDLEPGDLIFPGKGRVMTHRRLGRMVQFQTTTILDQVHKIVAGVTTHGFRSTITAWGVTEDVHGELQPFSLALMDRVLGHKLTSDKEDQRMQKLSGAMGSYTRNADRDPYFPAREKVMRRWSDFLLNYTPPVAEPMPLAA